MPIGRAPVAETAGVGPLLADKVLVAALAVFLEAVAVLDLDVITRVPGATVVTVPFEEHVVAHYCRPGSGDGHDDSCH
jgi:small-conductance mechanosensitive channel